MILFTTNATPTEGKHKQQWNKRTLRQRRKKYWTHEKKSR
jgi:hypothetical protein